MTYKRPIVENLGNAACLIQGAKQPPPPETTSGAEDLHIVELELND